MSIRKLFELKTGVKWWHLGSEVTGCGAQAPTHGLPLVSSHPYFLWALH